MARWTSRCWVRSARLDETSPQQRLNTRAPDTGPSKTGYQDSVLPGGYTAGAPEAALNTAC